MDCGRPTEWGVHRRPAADFSGLPYISILPPKMPRDQVFMGVAIAAACLAGLWKGRWFLTNTRKGRRLVGWLGENSALWILRGLLASGLLFGILLAGGIINPVRW